MADIADMTSARAEYDMRDNMILSRRPSGPEETGFCLNCGPEEPLPTGHRWCNEECRDDWEAEQKRARQIGQRRAS